MAGSTSGSVNGLTVSAAGAAEEHLVDERLLSIA